MTISQPIPSSSVSFVTGGTLPVSASSYVHRQADTDLLEGLLGGEFCYVLNSRQMGKSSLMVRTVQRLRERGIAAAVVDLNAFGNNLTIQQWYRGLLNRVGEQLDLEDELEAFWEGHYQLSPLQCWQEALRRVVLPHLDKDNHLRKNEAASLPAAVIFIDEIDMVRSLRFSADEFLGAIRQCYTGRATDLELGDLSFCLLGVAAPSDLVSNPHASPFNIGRRVEVRDFTPQEAAPLANGLGAHGTALLQRILYWTSGHPYLTQQLCRAALDAGINDAEQVDSLCETLFFKQEARTNNDNLAFVRNCLLRSDADLTGLLDLYARTRRLEPVVYVETDPLCPILRQSGVVTVQDGIFTLRNLIYARVFDETWIKQNRPRTEIAFLLSVSDHTGNAGPASEPAPPPNNLPTPLTSFIGREKQILEAKALLSKSRLLTLTGSGGAGKSRLSLQVAHEVLQEYGDGVWLIELAALTDPGIVAQTLANVLGVREEPQTPLVQTLVKHLKSKRLLIVLDNCEHLLTACASAANVLLHACPGVCVLATSRERMGLAGEVQYRVPSLSLPHPGQPVTIASIEESEAARLFVERARDYLPTFAPNAQNIAALVSICHRLDGMPLAIELAAARVRSLSVEEINIRLHDRFRLLTGGSRTALPRHQTLRALIQWSVDLLTEIEKVLLLRLSVFAGGWSLEAAEKVCVGEEIEAWEIVDLLTALVDKSLVMYEEHRGEARYRLLETVRQYAKGGLAESGQGDTYRGQHRDYFLSLAEEAKEKLRGSEQGLWLNRLETEHDNLRHALTFCLEEPGGSKIGLRLGSVLTRFWQIRGHVSEGRECLAALLARPEAREHTMARANALNGAGTLAYRQGDYASARSLHQESLEMRRELGDRQGIAASLYDLGNVAKVWGDYASARSLYQESLEIARELGDRRIVTFTLNNLGILAYEQGDYASARSLHQESLEMRRELGDRQGIAESLESFASLNAREDKREKAARLWGAAERLREEIGSPLPPIDREEYDRNMTALRQVISEDTFAAAWAEGWAMTLEQAIEFALNDSKS